MIKISRDGVRRLMVASSMFAFILGVIAISVSEKRMSGYSHQIFAQSGAGASHISALASSDEWAFDYPSIKALVQALVIGSDGKLILNSHATEILDGIADTLPDILTEADIERIGFLSQQEFDVHAVSDVAGTLTGFLRYRQARHRYQLNAYTQNGPLAALARFKQSVVLQDQYLGAVRAQQLFGQQRQLQHYLLERQAIQINPDLSSEQRLEILGRMSAQFKESRELEKTR